MKATSPTRLRARDHYTWWKRRSRSKFTSHYAWGTNGVYKWMQGGCKVYMALNESCFMVTWTIFKNCIPGSRPNTKLGDHGTMNAHNHLSILFFYHVLGPKWRELQWNSIWLRTWSHMALHYTWGFVTTLHDFGGVLGRPLNTSFWALIISWSRFLGRVWSGPHLFSTPLENFGAKINTICALTILLNYPFKVDWKFYDSKCLHHTSLFLRNFQVKYFEIYYGLDGPPICANLSILIMPYMLHGIKRFLNNLMWVA